MGSKASRSNPSIDEVQAWQVRVQENTNAVHDELIGSWRANKKHGTLSTPCTRTYELIQIDFDAIVTILREQDDILVVFQFYHVGTYMDKFVYQVEYTMCSLQDCADVDDVSFDNLGEVRSWASEMVQLWRVNKSQGIVSSLWTKGSREQILAQSHLVRDALSEKGLNVFFQVFENEEDSSCQVHYSIRRS